MQWNAHSLNQNGGIICYEKFQSSGFMDCQPFMSSQRNEYAPQAIFGMGNGLFKLEISIG